MDHVATMRRFYDLVNVDDIDGIGQLLADDLVEHEVMPGLEPTKEGVMAAFRMYRAAFPDLHCVLEDVFAGGDRVVVRGRWIGAHQGPFMDMPATAKRIDVPFIDIMRMGDDGLGHEHWGIQDTLAMMQQLGAVPEAPPTEAPRPRVAAAGRRRTSGAAAVRASPTASGGHPTIRCDGPAPGIRIW